MSINSKITLAVALFAVAVCAACQPSYVGSSGPRVGIAGDSVTAHAKTQVEGAFGGYRRSVMAVPGIDLADGRADLVAPLASTDPDVMVVELGINSALDGWTSADAREIDLIMRDLEDVPCVVWITPSALTPSYYDHLGPGTIAERIAAMRASVERRAAGSSSRSVSVYRNLHVADFGPVQMSHPQWFMDDHLHMNEAGHNALATFMRQSVEEAC